MNYNQGNYQPQFNPNYQQYPARYPVNETVSIGEWVGCMLLMCIPVVDIILIFVWAFSSSEKPSKRNFFKAILILMAIGLGITVFVFLVGLVIGLLRVL